MFKGVVRVTFLTIMAIAAFMLIKRIPFIQEYRACYQEAYTIINEKHTITRTTYMTQDTICANHKQTLLAALNCEQIVDNKLNSGIRERTILNNLGHLFAYGTKNSSELVQEHNTTCTAHHKQIQFDMRTQTWF